MQKLVSAVSCVCRKWIFLGQLSGPNLGYTFNLRFEKTVGAQYVAEYGDGDVLVGLQNLGVKAESKECSSLCNINYLCTLEARSVAGFSKTHRILSAHGKDFAARRC